MAGHASPEARPGASPSPNEERRADLSQSPSMIRREAQGRLAMPREGSRRRVARRAGPRCTTGWLTSPAGLTARALLELGALEGDGEGGAWGDGSSAISVSSAGRALQSKDQPKQREDQELGKGKAYSSMAKYFWRFSRR